MVSTVTIISLMSLVYVPSAGAVTIVDYGPKRGREGMPVNLIGQGFSGLTNVKVVFGNVDGQNTRVMSDQHIRSEVPAGLPENTAVVLYLSADQLEAIGAGGFVLGEPSPGISDVFPNRPILAGEPVLVAGVAFWTSYCPSASGCEMGPSRIWGVTFDRAGTEGTAESDTFIKVEHAPPPLPDAPKCFFLEIISPGGTRYTSPEQTCYA